MGRAGIREAYHTGRGRIIVRANSEIEAMSANRSRIVITEIPYQVNKARLVEKIAEVGAGQGGRRHLRPARGVRPQGHAHRHRAERRTSTPTWS